ncbi:MAG: hypothetical protein IPK62_08695 [Bacteroidetes bacterium]|nr:hypothetical protein [Bacteroidota bacterium]
MKNRTKIFTLLIWIIILGSFSCKKDNTASDTIKKLYKSYKNGEISECKFNGAIVYSAGINATDAGNQIYDIDGKNIGNCNYGWGNVDSICKQLTDCEVIYRVRDNIWGQPAVDKYGLCK